MSMNRHYPPVVPERLEVVHRVRIYGGEQKLRSYHAKRNANWISRGSPGPPEAWPAMGCTVLPITPNEAELAVSIGQSEVGPVENIEHLGSELEGFRFPQFEVANQREVPVGQTRPRQNISSRVSEGVRGRQGERGRICPLVDALMGGIEAHAGNDVRTIVVVNIVAGIAVDGGRVGRPGLQHGDPRHLPAVDEVVRLRVLQLSDLVPERQVVNIGQREALLVVEVRAALLRSEIVGILREAGAGIGTEVGGVVVEGFRPGIGADDRQAVGVVPLHFDLQGMINRRADGIGVGHCLEIGVGPRAGRVRRGVRNAGAAARIERVVRLVRVPLKGQSQSPSANVAHVKQPGAQLSLHIERPFKNPPFLEIQVDRVKGREKCLREGRRDKEVLEEESGGQRQPARRGRRGHGGKNCPFIIQQVSLGQLKVRRVEALLEIKLTDHLVVVNAAAGADDGLFISERPPGDAEARPKVGVVGAL